MEFYRVGICNDCGECCTFTTPRETKLCQHYDPDAEKHCRIYKERPSKCRLYPQRPADLAGLPHCAYKFFNSKAILVNPYDDPVYTSRLRRIHSLVMSK